MVAWSLSFPGQGSVNNPLYSRSHREPELAAWAKPLRKQQAPRIGSTENQVASPEPAPDSAAGIKGQCTGFQVAELLELA